MRLIQYIALFGVLTMVTAAGCSAQEASGGNLTGVRQHPCVMVTAATLPLLQAKCADQVPNQFGFSTGEVAAGILAEADSMAALPPFSYSVKIPGEGRATLEEWSYTMSDETPPPHPKSPNYPPWTAMFQERSGAITTRLVHFSFGYLVTGNDQYLAKAKELALHLTKWRQWTDESYGAGSIKACLDTGHCTYAMAMFYDWCFDALSPAERREVRTALIEKGIEPILGYVDHYPPDTNGYAVLLSGATLASLAVRPDDARGAGYLQQCIEKARVSLDRGGKDGGTFEGPMYGTYLLDSLALAFDGLIAAGVEHDLFQHPYLKTMPRYCLGLLAPDTKQIPCFSDGSPGVAVPRLMSILAQQGAPEAAYYLQTINAIKPSDIYGLIRFDASRLQAEAPTWNPSSVFVDIGYASLRDGFNAEAPSLFFKSGPTTNSIGHNHYDHNAFVISYRNQWLAPDRGYHDFYVAERRKFSLGSLGHSTIVLDVDDAYMHDQTVPSPGHEQVRLAGGRISEFFAGDGFDYVKGEAAAAYNGDGQTLLDRFDRQIVYVKPNFFIMRDTLAAPAPHAYSWLLHSDGSGEFATEGDQFTLTRIRAQLWGKVLSSAPVKLITETYPGAEAYGPYLRAETSPARRATFTSLLYPRPWQDAVVIRNGGFEDGMTGWRPRANEDMANHEIVTDDPAEGIKCARIERSGYYYSMNFPAKSGDRITARVKVRTSDLPAGQGAQLTLYFWAGGKSFANVSTESIAHRQWQDHEMAADVPEGTEEVCLALTFSGDGTVWFDDARMAVETDEKVEKPLTPQVTALGDSAMDITLGEERYLVVCGTPGTPTETGGLATDGSLAIVGLSATGAPIRAFLQGGTRLSWQGRELLGLTSPGTVEARLADGRIVAQVSADVTPHAPLPEAVTVRCGWRATAATLNGRPATVTAASAGSSVALQ